MISGTASICACACMGASVVGLSCLENHAHEPDRDHDGRTQKPQSTQRIRSLRVPRALRLIVVARPANAYNTKPRRQTGTPIMEMTRLPFRAGLAEYLEQAARLLDGWRSADPAAIEIFTHRYPGFLDPTIPWLPSTLSEAELRSTTLELPDAQLTIARW